MIEREVLHRYGGKERPESLKIIALPFQGLRLGEHRSESRSYAYVERA